MVGDEIIPARETRKEAPINGITKIMKGWMTRPKSFTLERTLMLVSPVLGSVIIVAGKLVEFIQSIFHAQASRRLFMEDEQTDLKRIFGDSLKYDRVSVVEGRSGLFGLNSRPFTLGNTIFTKEWPVTMELLVHETVHAWQYQQVGARYAGEAVLAQWLVPDAYNWEREIDTRERSEWTQMNREAQAQFIQDLWAMGELLDHNGSTVQIGNGAFFNAAGEEKLGVFMVRGKDYTSLAYSAVETLRET